MYRPEWCEPGDNFHAQFAAPHGLPFRARYIRNRFTVLNLAQDLALA